MARQKGFSILKGTIAGLNFYTRKGEPLVRKAGGGFNGDAIKHKDSMVRVRENGSEFGRCAQVTKYFKKSLNPFLTLFTDGTRHQRLVQLFTQIKDCDPVSIRGERSVSKGIVTALGCEKMLGYVVSSGATFSSLIQQSYHFGWDAEGLRINNFSMDLIRFPKGASHFELHAGYLIFDFETYAYSFVSGTTLVAKDAPPSTVSVVPTVLPERDGTKIGIVFFRFMQEISGVFYPFKEQEYTVMEIVYLES